MEHIHHGHNTDKSLALTIVVRKPERPLKKKISLSAEQPLASQEWLCRN